MASTVAAIMPPVTPVPIACRAPAPAPVLMTSGSTPNTNASEVMRMGRSRKWAASSTASTRPCPSACRSFANSTIRMAFFVERPMVASSPTLK